MQSLRSILQSNLFFLFLFFLAMSLILYTYFFPKKSNYSLETTEIIGTITNYSIDKNQGKFTVNGKEKVIVYYSLKEEEKNDDWLGSVVQIKGRFVEPKETTIPNTFSYKKYLSNKQIFYLCYATSMEKMKKPNVLYSIKNKIYRFLDQNPNHAYLNAILLGKTDELDMTDMKKNGVSHLVAISGMHFGIFISLLRSL